jgi:hypothetical protein
MTYAWNTRRLRAALGWFVGIGSLATYLYLNFL